MEFSVFYRSRSVIFCVFPTRSPETRSGSNLLFRGLTLKYFKFSLFPFFERKENSTIEHEKCKGPFLKGRKTPLSSTKSVKVLFFERKENSTIEHEKCKIPFFERKENSTIEHEKCKDPFF